MNIAIINLAGQVAESDLSEFTTDWSQFLPDLIATFIGFLLALVGELWLENYFDRKRNKKNANSLLIRLNDELNDAINLLGNIKQNTLNQNPIKTLVWDEAINSGLVSILDTDIRIPLYSIYKEIDEFNSWCNIKTNWYFEHYDSSPYNESLEKEIENQRQMLLGKIQKEGETYDSIPNVIVLISSKSKRVSKTKSSA